ncbi:4'-phosphopantetheinyl transferase superfamily protein [Streptomyces sp. HNM0574]|uniref:4'-phosphopantetheinyl transferase family protein n=1 Tax=Streptomyces sp. HNM0574 TaxID=2714954 RepID=UPI0019D2533C|nr:4'-phosphopantetheinyl transferase superfamily protein [Streptomyces sp. HNM0574]
MRVSAHAAAARREAGSLSAGERERAAAFRREADRDRYLVAHTALRGELAARLGGSPRAVPLTRAPCPGCGGPHGRPSVAGDLLHFSLSHAGDLVLLAFADAPVGADVEALPAPGVVADVGASLHPRERAELAALPERERPAAFTRCWTRKEAFLKGLGTGLATDPAADYVSTLERPAPLPGWHLADVPVPPGYAAATALARPAG